MLKKISLVILLIMITGCSRLSDCADKTEVQVETGTYTRMYDTVELYLFPAVSYNNPMLVIEDTVYDIFYFDGGERTYLGQWESNRYSPLKITNDTFNIINETMVLMPNMRLGLFVSGKLDGYKVYNFYIDYRIPDKPVDYYVPKLDIANESDIDLHVTPSRYLPDGSGPLAYPPNWFYDFQNWNIYTEPNTQYDFRIAYTDYPSFYNFCCEYDYSYVSKVAITSTHDGKISGGFDVDCDRGVREGKRIDDVTDSLPFTLSIYTSKFVNETIVTCHIFDYELLLTEEGDARGGTVDDESNDLGLPNPSFSIKLLGREEP